MDPLSAFFLPAFLFLVMLFMGMTLSVDDFKRVTKSPLHTAVGLFVQLIIAPLLAFSIAIILQLNTIEAVGLIILAACPGGAVSNLFSYLAKADTALSITLTAISSLITVFTIPFIVNFGLDYFANEGVEFHLPVIKTILNVSILTIFPLLIGLTIKKSAPVYCLKNERAIALSLLLIILLGLAGLLLFVSQQISEFDTVISICFSVILLNTILLIFGYCFSALFKIKRKQKVTIGIESGVQNVVLAVTIAVSPQFLNNPMFGVTAGLYGVLMCINSIMVIVWSRSLMRQNIDVNTTEL